MRWRTCDGAIAGMQWRRISVHPTHVRHIARADPGYRPFHSPSGHRLVARESAVLHPDIRRGSAVLPAPKNRYSISSNPFPSLQLRGRRPTRSSLRLHGDCLVPYYKTCKAFRSLCARSGEKRQQRGQWGQRNPRGRSICAIRAAAASARSARPQHLRSVRPQHLHLHLGRWHYIWVAGSESIGPGCGHCAGTSCICIWVLR